MASEASIPVTPGRMSPTAAPNPGTEYPENDTTAMFTECNKKSAKRVYFNVNDVEEEEKDATAVDITPAPAMIRNNTTAGNTNTTTVYPDSNVSSGSAVPTSQNVSPMRASLNDASIMRIPGLEDDGDDMSSVSSNNNTASMNNPNQGRGGSYVNSNNNTPVSMLVYLCSCCYTLLLLSTTSSTTSATGNATDNNSIITFGWSNRSDCQFMYDRMTMIKII